MFPANARRVRHRCPGILSRRLLRVRPTARPAALDCLINRGIRHRRRELPSRFQSGIAVRVTGYRPSLSSPLADVDAATASTTDVPLDVLRPPPVRPSQSSVLLRAVPRSRTGLPFRSTMRTRVPPLAFGITSEADAPTPPAPRAYTTSGVISERSLKRARRRPYTATSAIILDSTLPNPSSPALRRCCTCFPSNVFPYHGASVTA
jgi:hypothetical protein